ALEPLNDVDRGWILKSVISRWSIQSSASGIVAPAGVVAPTSGIATPLPQRNGEAATAIANKDIRAFMRIKKPETDVERVACLIYYLAKTTGQLGFKSRDVNQANTDYGGTRINITRALDNATRQSKFLSSREAGEKQLTPMGEDVVEALPDREAVASVLANHKIRKKGTKRKKVVKKK